MQAIRLDPEPIASFQRDGAVVIRNALAQDELITLERGIEANLASPGPLAAVASGNDDPGRFFEDFCNWQRIGEFERILRDSALPAIAAQLMRSATVRLYHDHTLVKEAATRQPTPWHQDQPYYNVDGTQNVSFWIPVDPVPRESTLEFLAGSHDGTWYMPRTFMNNEAKWFPEGSLADLPDMTSAEHPQVLGWAHHNPVTWLPFTCRRCMPAREALRGDACSARYLGDDAVHAPRAWRTSPEFRVARATSERPDGPPAVFRWSIPWALEPLLVTRGARRRRASAPMNRPNWRAPRVPCCRAAS